MRHGPVLLAIALALAAGAANAVSFSRADKDGDGQVTYAEARRTMPRLSEIHFGKCDRGADGLMGTGEFACLDALYAIQRLPDD